MPRRPLLALALLACPLAACGAERVDPPTAAIPANAGLREERFPAAGLRLSLPSVTLVERRLAPSLFRANYLDWYIAGFVYRRTEQLPRRRPELTAARRRLVAEVRRRNRRFKVVRSRVTRIDKAPAIELIGDQTISRSRLRTRSVHIYKGRAEYVLELVAPVVDFGELQKQAFNRVVESVRVTGKVKKPPREKDSKDRR